MLTHCHWLLSLSRGNVTITQVYTHWWYTDSLSQVRVSVWLSGCTWRCVLRSASPPLPPVFFLDCNDSQSVYLEPAALASTLPGNFFESDRVGYSHLYLNKSSRRISCTKNFKDQCPNEATVPLLLRLKPKVFSFSAFPSFLLLPILLMVNAFLNPVTPPL